MTVLRGANLALRFFLELGMLAAFGYWGVQAASGSVMKVVLGVGAPLLAAVFWGTFLSPKAAIHLSQPARLGLEVVVFGLAAIALVVSGQTGLALIFAALVVLNRLLMSWWGS